MLQSDHGHIVAKVRGAGVFRAFQHETGQHVVQRVPPTERKGRRHTSLIAVAVLPIKENLYHSLPESEMEITAQRGSQKAGGQKVNKTSSAIRAKHLPTGITVFIQNERSQAQNKQEAIRILTARVNDERQAKEDAEYAKFRAETLGSGRRGSKVRTYNWISSFVKDHRLGRKTGRVDEVMAGKFGLLLD